MESERGMSNVLALIIVFFGASLVFLPNILRRQAARKAFTAWFPQFQAAITSADLTKAVALQESFFQRYGLPCELAEKLTVDQHARLLEAELDLFEQSNRRLMPLGCTTLPSLVIILAHFLSIAHSKTRRWPPPLTARWLALYQECDKQELAKLISQLVPFMCHPDIELLYPFEALAGFRIDSTSYSLPPSTPIV